MNEPLPPTPAPPSSVSQPADLASTFLDGAKRGAADLGPIDQLCRLAFQPDPVLARAATTAIFGGVIEPLCDDFSSRGVETANLVLTRILDFIRRTPQGRDLDQRLNDLGFRGAADILARYRLVSQPRALGAERLAQVRKAIILSRVTAGADIAITSVILHRLRQRLPQAELVLIGPGHLSELFAGSALFRHRLFIYRNDGFLFDKMTSWPQLLEISREEQAGFNPARELLLFDPDTRLSQLGLLPLLPIDSTCYFPSRSTSPASGASPTLSALANQWLNQVLDEEVLWRPQLVFQDQTQAFQAFRRRLRDKGCRRLVTVNFGVGNNPRKRVHGSFEEDLIPALLGLPGTVVVLDSGRGNHSQQRLADHMHRVRQHGWPAICLTDQDMAAGPEPFDHGLIVFAGGLGALGKMIDAADCFIGYDSCGQHLAAATGTPSVIVFAGAPSDRFIARWAPESSDSLTIPCDGTVTTPTAIGRLIDDIVRHLTTLRPRETY